MLEVRDSVGGLSSRLGTGKSELEETCRKPLTETKT